jgi:hypothetical protein
MRSIFVVVRLPVVLLLVALSFLAPRVSASTLQAQERMLCDQAARVAAREYGIPQKIMEAIARTESGVTVDGAFVPWPWTINVEGRGVRFTSQREALAYFKQHYGQGARNIDLGCFQINHRWHGAEFESVQSMLDPKTNARYAARFLKELHGEFGDWTRAAGAFHSRNEEFSTKYLARFVPILRALNNGTDPGLQVAENERENAFPLLTGTSHGSAMGSLFPTAAGSRGSLFGPGGERG